MRDAARNILISAGVLAALWLANHVWGEKSALGFLAIFIVCGLQAQIGGLRDKIEWLEADIRRLKGLD